jgi:type I restriction enzyme, S subunit
MTVRPGYKETEVGLIPQEWVVRPLRSVLTMGRLGGNYANWDTEAEFPLMKMGNIARGSLDLSKVQFIVPGVTPASQHRLVYGDVLFNTRNTLELVGKVAIWRNELPVAYYNSNLLRLEFNQLEICSNEYVNFALNAARAIARLRELATGTTSVAAIYTRDLLGFQLIVPPHPEQRAIAAALSDVDALLGGLDRLIAKKRHLKQAAMQQLLTGQTRLPGFQEEWDTVKAGDIGQFRGGNAFPIKFQGAASGEYPFFKVSDMNNTGNETFMQTANHYISEALRRQLGATAFPAESIVFAKVGAAVFLERKKLLSRASCLDNNMAAFTLTASRADVRFVHHMLLNTKLGSLVSTTALPSLSGSVLASIELRLPSLPEQTAIATVLSDMDAELSAVEARRTKTHALKQAMMQELLTGKTRLV